MLRRDFFAGAAAFATVGSKPQSRGDKIAAAAQSQSGITKTYDPAYTHIAYPNGDVPRDRGICADVIVRACRDAVSLDLQQLVHDDMKAHFSAYPAKWGARSTDASIDHRRVLNLEVFWTRAGARLWTPGRTKTAGDEFPTALKPGDFVSWLLNGHLPHIAVVSDVGMFRTTVVHNWANGAETSWLHNFAPHVASGHFRWPVS